MHILDRMWTELYHAKLTIMNDNRVQHGKEKFLMILELLNIPCQGRQITVTKSCGGFSQWSVTLAHYLPLLIF